MTIRRKRWLIGGSAAAVLVLGGLFFAAAYMGNQVEPFIREQALKYMRSHFDGEVELGQLKVHFAPQLPLRILFKRPGTLAQVEGHNLLLRHLGRRDLPPLFTLKRLNFEVDVAGGQPENGDGGNKIVIKKS